MNSIAGSRYVCTPAELSAVTALSLKNGRMNAALLCRLGALVFAAAAASAAFRANLPQMLTLLALAVVFFFFPEGYSYFHGRKVYRDNTAIYGDGFECEVTLYPDRVDSSIYGSKKSVSGTLTYASVSRITEDKERFYIIIGSTGGTGAGFGKKPRAAKKQKKNFLALVMRKDSFFAGDEFAVREAAKRLAAVK